MKSGAISLLPSSTITTSKPGASICSPKDCKQRLSGAQSLYVAITMLSGGAEVGITLGSTMGPRTNSQDGGCETVAISWRNPCRPTCLSIMKAFHGEEWNLNTHSIIEIEWLIVSRLLAVPSRARYPNIPKHCPDSAGLQEADDKPVPCMLDK